MDIEKILTPEIQAFIDNHRAVDPIELILRHKDNPSIPIQDIVNQIVGQRIAKQKLPTWFNTPFIIYPNKLSLEQCSSEITAQWKSNLVGDGNICIDLTGGFGVDSFFFSKHFKKTYFIEKNEELIRLVKHNFKLLQPDHSVEFICSTAEEFIKQLNFKADLIYIDPSRRGSGNKKVFSFQESEPVILTMIDSLLETTNQILIKASPFLDIKRASNELKNVKNIYIVAVENECKEILYAIEKNVQEDTTYHTIHLINGTEQKFHFSLAEEKSALVHYVAPLQYIYEPNIAILKSGAFRSIAQRFSIEKLHPNTHLYTSGKYIDNFPGRIFECKAICSFNQTEVQNLLNGQKPAILLRHFPYTIDEVKKKLDLKEGNDLFLIATTLMPHKPKLLITTCIKKY